MGEEAFIEGAKVADGIRKSGKTVVMEHDRKSLKSQLKKADRLNAGFAIIIGEEEIKDGCVIIRNMSESSEVKVKMGDQERISEVIG